MEGSRKRPFYFFGKGARAEKGLKRILGGFGSGDIFTTCAGLREKWGQQLEA
jgi:hypothetical protein